MANKVLTANALLAFLRDDPGAAMVEHLLIVASKKGGDLLMSEVAFASVKSSILKADGDAAWTRVSKTLETLPIEFVPATRRTAELAGSLQPKHSIPLDAAFSAALAFERKAELVTGDQVFSAIENEVQAARRRPS